MRKNIATKFLGRKFKLGRMSIPVWLVGLAVLLVAAAAGQAVGPVLSGGVQGSAGLTVEQSVLLSSTASDHSVVYASPHGDDAVVTVNDDGTGFTAAIEMHVGDTLDLMLDVDNVSDASANAIIELSVPGGLNVELEEDGGASGLAEAQLTRNSWLATVDSGATGTMNVTISPKDDLRPGFYTITGRLVQVAN
ncbi:MAG: hypothetical protein QF878_08735 [SAR202 cluster bacterium]|nr:hypothetical protein [SAR202 cluster bacterium]MDP6714998.1 hypothetical protein [SAR202 cluster bacterium]